MAGITENDIKKAALALLVQHYRFRPRGGPATQRFDLRAEGDIIVDGALSFPREEEDRPPFLATLEATSWAKRQEVYYRLRVGRLAWDGAAAGALLASGLFALLHAAGTDPVNTWGIVPTILAALALAAALQAAYMLLFSSLKRYRFIYAVEQFKQYFADEQWIAVGEDVFADTEDKYFRELRNQCIFQGVGLLIVDREGQVHKHITPSRTDLFEGRRRRLRLPALPGLPRPWSRALPPGPEPKRIGEAPAPVRARPRWMRDPFQYAHPFSLVLLGITLLATVMYLEWRERPVLVVNEAAYDQRLLAEKAEHAQEAEPLGYLVDTPDVPPFRSRVEPYLRLDPSPARGPAPLRQPPGLIAIDAQGRVRNYPCARARSSTQTRYALELRNLEYREPLEDLLRRLQRAEVRALGLWLGCFTADADGYALVLAPFYNTRARAERALPEAERALAAAGFRVNVRLRVLPAGQ